MLSKTYQSGPFLVTPLIGRGKLSLYPGTSEPRGPEKFRFADVHPRPLTLTLIHSHAPPLRLSPPSTASPPSQHQMRRVNVGHNVFRWRRPARGFAFTPGRNRIIHPAFAHRPEAWAEPKPQPQRAATPLPKVEQKVAPEAPEKKELTKEQLRQFMAHQEAREQEAKRRQRARRTKAKVTWVAVRRNAPAWATRRFEIRQWGAEVFRAKMMAREEALAIAAPDVWKEAAEARQEISKQDVRKAAREAARKAARKASSRAAHKARQDRKERRARNELRNELRARRKLIAATGARPPVSSRIRAGHLKTAPEDIRRRNSIRTWKDIVGADIEAENPRGSSKPFTRLEVRHIQPYDGFVTKTDYEVVSDWNTRRRPGEPLLLRVPGSDVDPRPSCQ